MDCSCDCHSKGCPKITLANVVTATGTATVGPASFSVGYPCGNCGTFISSLNNATAHQCWPTIDWGQH